MSSRPLSPFTWLVRLMVFVALVGALVIGAAQIPGVGDWAGDRLSALNPFERNTVDRTGPAVLQSLTRLSEFKAASGYYEVVVDLDDRSRLPNFISGDRVIYVGKGEVEAVVDFSELDERRIALSEDGKSVTVRLPAPTIGEPKLNLQTSYVAAHDEGFITKFKGSDSERKAQLEAIGKMTAAASGEGKLIELAEDSTTAMLRGLFGSLGYTSITITFDEPPAGGT